MELNTSGNLYNSAAADTDSAISGKNIILNAGKTGASDPYGSIGTASKYMTITLKGGNISATATGNINIQSLGTDNPLIIDIMSAGKTGESYNTESGNIFLKSASDIYLAEKTSTLQNYISSKSNGQISLQSDGSIGSAEHIVRIINSGKDQKTNNFATDEGVISLTAVKDIYAEGVSTAAKDSSNRQAAGGYFNLKTLNSTDGDVQLTINGTLNLNQDVTVTKDFKLYVNESADLYKNITAKNIVMTATNNISMADGVKLKAETVTLTTDTIPTLSYGTIAKGTTGNGVIRQGNETNYTNISGKMDTSTTTAFDGTSAIEANELLATATKGIYLGGKNDSNNVVLHNKQNDVVYHNVADK